MPELHGSLTRLYVNGVDISTGFRETECGTERELVDATAFGAGDDRHVVQPWGMGMVSASGMLDVEPIGGAHVVEQMLQAAVDDLDGDSLVVQLLRDEAIGDPAFVLVGTTTQHRVSNPHRDVAGTAFDARANVARWGRVLHPRSVEAAAFNGARLDHGSATAAGGLSALQVFDLQGEDPVVQVTIQHDNNDGVWVDLCDHAVVNAAAVAARYRDVQFLTGSIQRGLRVKVELVSGTLTGIDFAVQFARY